MRANAGTGKKRGNSHTEEYWKRLKKQFKNSSYDHTGAYSELRQRSKSPERRTFERQLELAEQIMLTREYKNLRERLAYGKNTKRLTAVLNRKVTA